MFKLKLRGVLGLPDPDYPRPALGEGEEIILEGTALFAKALFGARGGRLILTNRRLIWYENKAWMLWPFKRIVGQFNLSDIASVDKGTWLDVVGGGRRLRLRLRSGKDKCLWEGQGRLDEWVATIRTAIRGSADA